MRLDRGRLKLLSGKKAMELRDLHWFPCTAEAVSPHLTPAPQPIRHSNEGKV